MSTVQKNAKSSGHFGQFCGAVESLLLQMHIH